MAENSHLNELRKRLGLPDEDIKDDNAPDGVVDQNNNDSAAGDDDNQTNDADTDNAPEVKTGADLTPEQLLAQLKLHGVDVASIEDLLPKEKVDPELAREQREADKLSYGLKKGLFKKSEYENFVTDSKDVQNLVYASFYTEEREDDPDITDEEIQEKFISKYGLGEASDSKRFQRGQREIKVLADKILHERYGKIVGLDAEYSAYESAQTEIANTGRKLTSETPAYERTVNDVLGSLSKIKVKVGDKDLDIELPAESINAVRDVLMNEDQKKHHVLNGYTPEIIQNIASMSLKSMSLDAIVQSAVNQALLEKQAGARGIVLPTGRVKEEVKNKYTEAQLAAFSRMGLTPATN